MPAGYGWCFPAADEQRIGVGSFDPRFHVKETTVLLAEDLERPPVRYQGNWIPHKLRGGDRGRDLLRRRLGGPLPAADRRGDPDRPLLRDRCGRELRAVIEGAQDRTAGAARLLRVHRRARVEVPLDAARPEARPEAAGAAPAAVIAASGRKRFVRLVLRPLPPDRPARVRRARARAAPRARALRRRLDELAAWPPSSPTASCVCSGCARRGCCPGRAEVRRRGHCESPGDPGAGRGDRAAGGQGAYERAHRRGAPLAPAGACRSWLMRNTLFLFAEKDLAWLRPLLADRLLVPALRRLDQEGMPEKEVNRVLGLIADQLSGGPVPRAGGPAGAARRWAGAGREQRPRLLDLHVAALRGVFAIKPPLEPKQTFAAPTAERADRARGGAGPPRPALPRGSRARDAGRPRLLGQDPEGDGPRGLRTRRAQGRTGVRKGHDERSPRRRPRRPRKPASRWCGCSAPGITGCSPGRTAT